MRCLLLAALLWQASAARAQNASTAPAAAAAPAAPFAHEAELREAAKYLSLALERGALLPAAGLDALGKEAARFTDALKKAVGPDLLREAAAGEKAAEDRRRAAAAVKALAEFRQALRANYAETGGYPADPAALVPASLAAVPAPPLPDHEGTSAIKVIGSKKPYPDLGKAVTDDGGWLYFSDPASEHYGLLLINCGHKSPDGTEFYKY